MKALEFSSICILLSVLAPLSLALKCRTGDGPSDEDLKRVARSCMRKVGEATGRYHQNQSDSSHVNYDDRDYDDYSRDERYRQANRDRLQMRHRRVRRLSNDRRYDPSSSGPRNQNQNQRPSGNGHYGGGGQNNSSHGDRQSRDMQDGACVVHCFFEELNMLNNDDYPDKHKVNYVLTKDIRDRELRVFYADTIQECFHYLEMQRRKEKCQFSKELIKCMMEYARANCEDWQDHTLIFS